MLRGKPTMPRKRPKEVLNETGYGINKGFGDFPVTNPNIILKGA